MRDATFRARSCAIAAFVASIGCTNGMSNAATIFPTVTGESLSGHSFTLPRDVQAPASIVFIAYVRGQQAQVDSWKPVIAEGRRHFPSIGVYEVPTLPKSDLLFRWFIDGGMRRGIPDAATRDTTITLYINKAPFNEALDIESESDITVVLVRPSGAVLWRSTGAYTSAKGAELTEALAALETSPGG